MALEQSMAVAALARKLCQASVSGAMMSKEEADGIISSLDPDSTGVLTKTEIMKLVIYTYERSGQKASPILTFYDKQPSLTVDWSRPLMAQRSRPWRTLA